MRFINHNQVLIDMQYLFVKRNAWLVCAADFAVVINFLARSAQRVRCSNRIILRQAKATVQTCAPCLLANKGKVRTEKFE